MKKGLLVTGLIALFFTSMNVNALCESGGAAVINCQGLYWQTYVDALSSGDHYEGECTSSQTARTMCAGDLVCVDPEIKVCADNGNGANICVCSVPSCEIGEISESCGVDCPALPPWHGGGRVGHGQTCPTAPASDPYASDYGCVTNGVLSECDPLADSSEPEPTDPTADSIPDSENPADPDNPGNSNSFPDSPIDSSDSTSSSDQPRLFPNDCPAAWNDVTQTCTEENLPAVDYCRIDPSDPLCADWEQTIIADLCPDGSPRDPLYGCDYNYTPPDDITCPDGFILTNSGECIVIPTTAIPTPPDPPPTNLPPAPDNLTPNDDPTRVEVVNTISVDVAFDTSAMESKLDQIVSNTTLTNSDAQAQIGDAGAAGDSALDDMGLSAQAFLDGIDFQPSIGIDTVIEEIFPTGSGCGTANFDFGQGIVFSLDTCDFAVIKNLIGWMFYAYTAWFLFSTIITIGRK